LVDVARIERTEWALRRYIFMPDIDKNLSYLTHAERCLDLAQRTEIPSLQMEYEDLAALWFKMAADAKAMAKQAERFDNANREGIAAGN
jgi:hypothetical protein